MPLQVPVIDDRSFEQLLDEAKRRIPAFTPEWTNFGLDSDPGITIIQLFAFLTESLLYRANRYPDNNRIKFLQLLGVPMQPAAAADGIITIRNDRGPLEPLPLGRGVVVSAGNVDFLTRDGVNVLPLEAQVFYKHPIPKTDPRYAGYQAKYEAIQAAKAAELAQDSTTGGTADTTSSSTTTVELKFYESLPMPAPSPSDPQPVLDLAADTIDGAIYLALLAPQGFTPDDVRDMIANQTLSIGIVPVLAGEVPPLQPLQVGAAPSPLTNLTYKIADPSTDATVANYTPLRLLQGPDVLTAIGIVQVQLPGRSGLQTWSFPDPFTEGMDEFPPQLEDEQLKARLITWIRIGLPPTDPTAPATTPNAKLTWVGINAARVYQAVPVFNELLGLGSGEPDQLFTLANTPILPASMVLVVQDASGASQTWRMTDDLLSAAKEDQVFSLDAESGQVRFGDGLRGARPPSGTRLFASYEYGGGTQGNVGVGAIKASRDSRLQGGYKIENPIATSGGDLGETVAHAERNIPLFLSHRDRLVTVNDFHDIAKRTSGVDMGRVEVLPLFLPSSPQDSAAGVVTVMVIPAFDAVNPLWPRPDRLFLRRVCDYLDRRRLVTTEVFVRGPQYVPVWISVGIQVQGGFFADLVRQTVSDRLNGYLSSLPPGGAAGRGWPLSKRLLQKDLEAVVTRVPGIEFVDSLEMGVGSPTNITEYDMSGLMLPMLVGLNVTEGAAQPLASVFGPAGPKPTPPTTQVVPVPVTRAKC